MRTFARIIAGAALVAVLPGAAWAQTSAIAGTVKDASGAVLPGVTVEASSPALIERVRSAVSDGNGQYKIEALRPGTYTVTYSATDAAGNVGTATRTIHVVNDAEYLAGTYTTTESGSPSWTRLAPCTTTRRAPTESASPT